MFFICVCSKDIIVIIIAASIIVAIDGNSATVGINGNDMSLSLGAKNGCIAHAFAETLNARVLDVTILASSPDAAGISQMRNL